jgi:hypothetical protein
LDDACGGRCNAEYNPCYQQATAKTIRSALSRKALDDLAEIDRELGLDDMQPKKQAPYLAVYRDGIKMIDPVTGDVSIGTPHPDLANVGEVGVWGEPVIDKSSAKRIATQLGWQPKREWQGLTDEEMRHEGGQAFGIDIAFDGHLMRFARAIEDKLKERNT